MQRITETALERALWGFFTRAEAGVWLDVSTAALDALLKRAVQAGEILRIRRGLFCLDRRFTAAPPNPLALAQLAYGPSYLSAETALGWHGWIPEAVQAIVSTGLGRSREFASPFGTYVFQRVPQKSLMAGVQRIAEGPPHVSFLMARPLKALADYVYTHHCDWHSAGPLRGSMRIEDDSLAGLSAADFDELKDQYRSGRVRRFLAGLRRDLKL
ncbi:MAG: type IV toxin-antitoxin system AbiEi family antitoxin domain-containing protein [Akkermansiaceae bacterium]